MVVVCRLTSLQDKEWFDTTLMDKVVTKLGPNYRKLVEPSPAFVDFMRYSIPCVVVLHVLYPTRYI